jgi:rare lipoprotein A
MSRRIAAIAPALALALFVSGCASSRPKTGGTTYQRGVASWYGPGFHGRFTASGERYDMDAMTAAHPTLPFGTLVEVRNLENGRRATVRINDRGPFEKRRIIDLSRAAAREIGMLGPGTARVELAAVGVVPSAPRVYAVQVAAFRESGRAAELAAALGRDYRDVVVLADGVWHRVQVGRFADRAGADSLRDELAASGLSAIVVPLSASDRGTL